MSQVDDRNSSAVKRPRTDGGRREDDWMCPSCGNANFSFRTTCNMKNCTQPRPADHTKFGPKPLQAPPPYMGPATPSSMYLSNPPYGSAYHYDYGSPYGPYHLSGPPPHYGGGSMLPPGGLYGVSPLMDRYGMPMRHGTMAPRTGSYLEESSQREPEGRANDWICPTCGNNNYSFRNVCNMSKCKTQRPGTQLMQKSKSKNSKGSTLKMPDGSWKCEKCNNINYPFRTKCNLQSCGAEKPPESSNTPDEGDQ